MSLDHDQIKRGLKDFQKKLDERRESMPDELAADQRFENGLTPRQQRDRTISIANALICDSMSAMRTLLKQIEIDQDLGAMERQRLADNSTDVLQRLETSSRVLRHYVGVPLEGEGRFPKLTAIQDRDADRSNGMHLLFVCGVMVKALPMWKAHNMQPSGRRTHLEHLADAIEKRWREWISRH